jgi:spermidine synthase
VLVLGGGDGLALREILKYPQIESVTLVDLDPAMTRLFASAPPLRKLNQDALHSAEGAGSQCRRPAVARGKRRSIRFRRRRFSRSVELCDRQTLQRRFLPPARKAPGGRGLAVVQSTSPLYARQSFWCVVTTLESVGLIATPYHALVPSFGEWGFVLAGRRDYRPPQSYAVDTRFLSPETTPALFSFPRTWRASRPR